MFLFSLPKLLFRYNLSNEAIVGELRIAHIALLKAFSKALPIAKGIISAVRAIMPQDSRRHTFCSVRSQMLEESLILMIEIITDYILGSQNLTMILYENILRYFDLRRWPSQEMNEKKAKTGILYYEKGIKKLYQLNFSLLARQSLIEIHLDEVSLMIQV